MFITTEKKMSNEFYVYIYFDPSRDMEPFYVGKGKGNRSSFHLKRNDRSLIVSRIKHLKSLSISPVIERHEHLNEREALDLEMRLIALIGRKDLGLGPLCNMTDGGDGVSGLVMPESARAKQSEKAKGNKRWLGRVHSEETRAKIGKSRAGKQHSEESKLLFSKQRSGSGNAMYGKSHTQETIEKIKAKARSRQVLSCQHCGKEMTAQNIARYHGDKCKEKKN